MGSIEQQWLEIACQRLGWTLIHFLWQGVAVAVILAALMHLLKQASAQTRYGVAGMALLVMVVAPILTLTAMIDPASTEMPMPQTPPAKKVIEQAIKEARSLDHRYVGTEHMLLGLLGVRDGISSEVLIALGVEAEAVREKVVELVGPRGMNRLDTGLPSPPEPGDLEPASFVRFLGEMPLLGERISKLEQAVDRLTEEIRALRRDLEAR